MAKLDRERCGSCTKFKIIRQASVGRNQDNKDIAVMGHCYDTRPGMPAVTGSDWTPRHALEEASKTSTQSRIMLEQFLKKDESCHKHN